MGPILYVVIASILFAVYKLRNVGRRPKDLPPGPPTIPILGNLHLMPAKQPHLQFKKWAEEYGPVYSLILGSSVMIVLSSDQAIKDLLDKRSNIYSSRPPVYIGQILSGATATTNGLRMLFMEYGKTWRMIRGTVHDHLNIRAAKSYIPYQDLENRQMLLGFLEQPQRWMDHMRRYTNSLTTQLVFGFRTTDIEDKKMHQLYDGFAEFSECFSCPEAQLMDIFPVLRRLPDALVPVKKRARALHKKEGDLYVGHWLEAKRKIQNGTANPCMCMDLVNSQAREGFSDPLGAYISGSMLEAGSDTSWSTLVGWMQAMVLFPDVAKKAQEEIDRVCGDRLPTLEDEPDMQCIRGCVKESMRWMPTAILGVPHAVIKDDMYMGYRIPKDAAVVMNVWGVHNDESRFPNPRAFNPDRYATDFQTASEAALTSDPSKRDHYLFGAGRRVCQGMHIAERSLFLAYSRLLWAFDFEEAEDESGKSLVNDPEDLTEGFLVHPRDVKVKIVVRDEKKAESVRREWDRVRDKLDGEGQWKKVPEGMFYKEYIPLGT